MNGEMTTDDVTELLDKLIKEDAEAKETLTADIDKKERRIKELTAQIAKAEEQKKAEASLKKSEEKLVEVTEKLNEAKAAMEAANEKKPQITELSEKISALKNELPLYDELEAKKKNLDTIINRRRKGEGRKTKGGNPSPKRRVADARQSGRRKAQSRAPKGSAGKRADRSQRTSNSAVRADKA